MAAASFENPVILNLMSTYGPLLIGAMFSCVLYGMAIIQMFLYFSKYERDSIWVKLYVTLVWAIETASTTCVLVSLWPVLILNWGSIHELSLTQRPLLHRVWVAGLGTFLVHLFYLYRIYMVNGRKLLLPCLLIPFALYQMVETWVYAKAGLSNSALSTLSGETLTVLGISGRVTIVIIDISITILMIHALLKDGTPEFRSSRRMVFKLIALTIHTGLWTAVFAIFVLVLYIPYQKELYYCAVDFPLTSLYLNSLLANLNAREYVRGTKTDVEYSGYQLGGSPRTPAFSKGSPSTPGTPGTPGFRTGHAMVTTKDGANFHIATSRTETHVKFDPNVIIDISSPKKAELRFKS